MLHTTLAKRSHSCEAARAPSGARPRVAQGACCTVAAHLEAARRRGELPQRFSLANAARPKVIDISEIDAPCAPESDVDPRQLLLEAMEAIRKANFVGKGDQATVRRLLSSFSSLIDEGLSGWSAAQQQQLPGGDTQVSLGAVVFEMAGA